MEYKVHLDSLKGDDNKGELNNQNLPFKTIDGAYTKLRDSTQEVLTFVNDKGDQTLNLPKYEKCIFSGKNPYVLKQAVTLNDVELHGSLQVILSVKIAGTILSTRNFRCTQNSNLKVIEQYFNTNYTYSDITLIEVNGDINIESQAYIEVNRKVTFINKLSCTLATFVMPNLVCQGGDLITDETETNNIINSSISNISLNYVNTVYYLSNKKSIANFSLGRCKNLKLSSVIIYMNLPVDIQRETNLFQVGNLELENTQLISNYQIKLGETNLIKINSKLIKIDCPKITSRVKVITSDYIIDDTDGDIFHIDFEGIKTINIIIPDALDIGSRTLFFKKLNNNHTNTLSIKVKYCYDFNSGCIILNHQRKQIELYQDNFVFYVKNVN
jgi:hypothetical protein